MKAARTPARWYPKVRACVGGPGLKVDRHKAEQQRQEVGDVVAGFGQQREGVGAEAGDKGNAYIQRGGDQRKTKDGLCPVAAVVLRRSRARRGHAWFQFKWGWWGWRAADRRQVPLSGMNIRRPAGS